MTPTVGKTCKTNNATVYQQYVNKAGEVAPGEAKYMVKGGNQTMFQDRNPRDPMRIAVLAASSGV